MGFGLIIIGDEILSGRRKDKHLDQVLAMLKQRGLSLSWVEIIGDDRPRITSTLQRTFATDDVVFSCGGIGATPDDHTRQCAAAALGVPLVLHPEAKQLIQQRMIDTARETNVQCDLDTPDNLHRLKMGEFPQGASIVPNFYNKIPGFSIAHGHGGAHYFVPGFPVMAWPMIEAVLDTQYSHLFHQQAWLEKSLIVYGAIEAALTPMMEKLERDYVQVKVFSLPSVGDAQTRRHIELGVKGEPQQVQLAFEKLQQTLRDLRLETSEP